MAIKFLKIEMSSLKLSKLFLKSLQVSIVTSDLSDIMLKIFVTVQNINNTTKIIISNLVLIVMI